jgi:hypothetical protein
MAMDFETESAQARKFIIGSAASAQREVDIWLRENAGRRVTDGDGLVWDLDLKITELPSTTETKGGQWHVSGQLTATATADEFIRTKTLDAIQDARLIELLEKGVVELRLKPMIIKCHSLEEVQMRVAELIPDLRTRFQTQPLRDIKRSLIGAWINQTLQFSGMREKLGR